MMVYAEYGNQVFIDGEVIWVAAIQLYAIKPQMLYYTLRCLSSQVRTTLFIVNLIFDGDSL